MSPLDILSIGDVANVSYTLLATVDMCWALWAGALWGLVVVLMAGWAWSEWRTLALIAACAAGAPDVQAPSSPAADSAVHVGSVSYCVARDGRSYLRIDVPGQRARIIWGRRGEDQASLISRTLGW